MPIYQYECKSCGNIFEKLKNKITDKEICPACGGNSKKIISPASFIINGYSSKNNYSKDK
jgi:putative FmdB family regulatory protein